MTKKNIKIENINCEHCTNTIEEELNDLKGVISVKANKDSKMVTIEWQEPPATWQQITDLLEEIGFPANA